MADSTKITFNLGQTHVSHVTDNSYAPFAPPEIMYSPKLVDAPTLLFGAKYALAISQTIGDHGTRLIPIHGVTDPLAIDMSNETILQAVQAARNADRRNAEQYAHDLYAPLVSAVAMLQAQVSAVCDTFYGRTTNEDEPDEIVEDTFGTTAPTPLDLNALMIGLANAEERLAIYMNALSTYRTKANFSKAPHDD